MTPTITPEALERIANVAEHIENAVEYIGKAHPGATMLDRGPILTGMRRWARKLRAALPELQAAPAAAGVPEGWILTREGDDIRLAADGVASFLVTRSLFRGNFAEFVWLFLDALLSAQPAAQPQAEQQGAGDAFEAIDLRFRSGNSIPVDRAMVTRAEWEALKAALAARQPVGEPSHYGDPERGFFVPASRASTLGFDRAQYSLPLYTAPLTPAALPVDAVREAAERALAAHDAFQERPGRITGKAANEADKALRDALAAPPAAADLEQVARLIAAIEGECDGLAISTETAAAILAHVSPAGQAASAYMVDGRIEQGLFFDRAAAETMATMNVGEVVPLFRSPAAVDLGALRQAIQQVRDWADAKTVLLYKDEVTDRIDTVLALIDSKAVRS